MVRADAYLNHFVFIPIMVLIAMVGCSITDTLYPKVETKDPNVEWKKDLVMKVNEELCVGMCLAKKADQYVIKIYPPNKEIDRLQWQSCHRSDFADEAVQKGKYFWKKDDKYFKMVVKPSSIELDRACPLRIIALTKKHKTMSFGMILFPESRPWYNLEAGVECSGERTAFGGSSYCQAPVGSIQRISFGGMKKVYQDETANDSCPPLKEIKPGVFEWFMPKDECVYILGVPERMAPYNEFRKHKLFSYGFQKNPPPEGT